MICNVSERLLLFMAYTSLSNILLSILIERPGATARRNAGREREQESEVYMAYGFVFILFWFDSHHVSYHSHLDTFHSLGRCFNSFPAHILPVLLFCLSDARQWAGSREQRKVSFPANTVLLILWPDVRFWCYVFTAQKGPWPSLYWAVQIMQEWSCPTELAVKVLKESVKTYSCTKVGRTRKQTYHRSVSMVVMTSDRQLWKIKAEVKVKAIIEPV